MDRKKIVIVVSLMLIIGISCAYVIERKHRARVNTAFSIAAITNASPSDLSWQTPRCEEDLSQIFDQKFRYLATGGQCFVFLSEDGKYVLKFFRQIKYAKKRNGLRKKARAFASYKVAYERMKEQTDLLYLHLLPHDGLHHQVTVIDPHHQEHTLELGDFEFIVQRFAEPILPLLKRTLSDQGIAQAKDIIDKAFAFFYWRLEHGICDYDPAIASNLGMVGGCIKQIDLGRLAVVENPKQWSDELREFHKQNRFFTDWLQKTCPELYAHYQMQCERLTECYKVCAQKIR